VVLPFRFGSTVKFLAGVDKTAKGSVKSVAGKERGALLLRPAFR
jgi:hypothetical protein